MEPTQLELAIGRATSRHAKMEEQSRKWAGFTAVVRFLFLCGGLFYAWAMTRTHAVHLAILEFGLAIYFLTMFAGISSPKHAAKLDLRPRLSLRWCFILISLPLIWLG